MKKKKLMLVVASIVMGTVSAMSLAACDSGNGGGGTGSGDQHTHEYVWGDVITPPTCEENGTQKGVCPEDNDTTTRDIPATGHDWKDWTINAPDDTTAGLAVKECRNDADNEHSVRVILPALSNENAYSVKDGDNGELIYTYAHDLGDIVFVVTPKSQSEYTVAEAVAYGTADSKHALVRSGEGILGGGRINKPTSSDFSYTYGDGYVYVNDGAMKQERYYQKDDGEDKGVFAVDNDSMGITIDYNATAKNLIGPAFYLTYATHNNNYYGVEDLVNSFYDWSQTSGTFDFFENVGEKDGKELVFSFGFSLIDVNFDFYLQVISVDFTLNASNVIDWVNVQSHSYIKSDYTGDEETGYTPTASANPYWGRVVMSQTMKTPDDVEPENPYSKDKIYISEVKYAINGVEIEDGATIKVTPNQAISEFTVKEILPSTAIASLDPISAYYVDENGEEQVCQIWDTKVNFYYDQAKKIITLKSTVAGDVVVKLRTNRSVFTLTLHADTVAPSVLNPYIYTYSEATDSYQGSMFTAATVYVGKQFGFTTTVNNPKTEEAGYTAKVTSSPSGAHYSLTDGEMVDGKDGTFFTTDTAGSYTIVLTSVKSSSTTATITVTVKDLPDMAETLNGGYENAASGITVTFTPDSDGATSGTVVIDDNMGSETLTYSCVGEVISLTSVSGVAHGYELSFNDVYTLVIVHNDGFEDNSYLLSKKVEDEEFSPEEILKNTTWTGTASNGTSNFIIFNENGVCMVGRGSKPADGGSMYMTANFTIGELDGDGNMKLTFSNTKDAGFMTQYAITASSANSGSYITVENGKITSITIKYIDVAVTLTLDS
ncbi:MAG: hypothetical protein K2O89_04955 [Clostridia bacterium]|nr:hypothetical protein [Clostridia bacterium]